MLYLLHGTDTRKSREKLHKLVEILLKKKPDAAHFRLEGETFSPDKLEEYIGGQGLFANRYIVLLDKVFENEEAKETILSKVKEIKASQNVFIILEEKLNKKELNKLEKHSEKVQEFKEKGNQNLKTEKFNIFKLTDAFGNRDRQKLWSLYQEALRNEAVPEEIHGILFWQLKSMLLVLSGDTSGMKPFVAGKAKGFIRNYSKEELYDLSSRMVSLYHDARRGIEDLDIGLEKLILSV